MLEQTVKLFTSKNTLVILIYPPATAISENPKAAVEVKIDAAVSHLANKYHLPLLRFDNDTSFTNDLFTDQWHLNLKGTVLYSKKIGEEINVLLKKQL